MGRKWLFRKKGGKAKGGKWDRGINRKTSEGWKKDEGSAEEGVQRLQEMKKRGWRCWEGKW